MLRAVQMLFSPAKAWEKVVAANRAWIFILLLTLVPIMAVTSAIEGYGLLKLGQKRAFGVTQVPLDRVIKYETLQVALPLLIILVGAYSLKTVAVSFGVEVTYSQTFAVMAYAYTPILWMHILDALPQINTWICWAIGVGFSFGIIYHGVGLCLRPEQTKGFGLLLFTIIFVTVLSGLAHFSAVNVLDGKLWRQPGFFGPTA